MPYITFCYAIKNGDIKFFWYVMKEIGVIFQVLAVSKLKYTRVMLKQLYIFDPQVADLIFQENYLVNIFVNPREQF